MRSRLIERLETALPKPALNDPHVSTELAEGVPYERILELAEERKIDIIILNTHGKSGLERALLGSTAERVVRGAHVPVFSVPPVAESEDFV
jgi:nucleotide-binding universal stress UspA family protein